MLSWKLCVFPRKRDTHAPIHSYGYVISCTQLSRSNISKSISAVSADRNLDNSTWTRRECGERARITAGCHECGIHVGQMSARARPRRVGERGMKREVEGESGRERGETKTNGESLGERGRMRKRGRERVRVRDRRDV